MDDWDEYWLDIHSDTCKSSVRSVQTGRIRAAKEKGCDGMDPDNVDSVNYPYLSTDEIQADLSSTPTVHLMGIPSLTKSIICCKYCSSSASSEVVADRSDGFRKLCTMKVC
jgi:hypothetical protein